MRVFEKILALLLTAGTIMWFLRLPMSSFLKLIAASSLCILYFLFGFALLNGVSGGGMFRASSYTETGEPSQPASRRLLPAVLGGLGLSLTVAGILFWLMIWPGGKTLLRFGVGMLALVALLVYVGRSESPVLWKQFISRAMPWAIVAILALVLPKYYLLDVKYGDDQPYLEAYKGWLDNPDDPEAMEAFEREDRRKFPEAYDYIE